MLRSNSDSTNSTTPISPFSITSLPSEPTSDENPSLGAFDNVLREWALMHPPRPRLRPVPAPATSTFTSSSYHNDNATTTTNPVSTVWNQAPVASYLQYGTTEDGTRVSPSDRAIAPTYVLDAPFSDDEEEDEISDASDSASSDTEGDRQTVDIKSDSKSDSLADSPYHDPHDIHDNSTSISHDDNEELPSLGSFSQALKFLEDEHKRLKLARQQSTLASSTATLTPDTLELPRRKRRRRRTKQSQRSKSTPRLLDGDDHLGDNESSDSGLGTTTSSATDAFKSSSSSNRERGRQPRQVPSLLVRTSRSVPQLREEAASATAVSRLRDLGRKLAHIFPQDRKFIKTIRYETFDGATNVVDTRGRSPSNKENESVIHVFIDHSNILIGLLSYLKRFPNLLGVASTSTPKPLKHLSHSALTLILERGRPVSRRVLCASSPLHQPLDSAKTLDYEVRVFARVPDTGDGMDRERKPSYQRHSRRESNEAFSSPKKGHGRKTSVNSSSAGDSDRIVSIPHTKSFTQGPSEPTSGPQTPSRVRYREQGVDELLQLKLHQALASIEGPPPPGSTIILATGDGNVGQFNEDGFLGSVRTALKRGWKVELYAWEVGLSRAWRREFGEGSEWGKAFKVVGMEQFGAELVEKYATESS